MSNTTITTNGNTTVTVIKAGNTTYTKTEIIDIKSNPSLCHPSGTG